MPRNTCDNSIHTKHGRSKIYDTIDNFVNFVSYTKNDSSQKISFFLINSYVLFHFLFYIFLSRKTMS